MEADKDDPEFLGTESGKVYLKNIYKSVYLNEYCRRDWGDIFVIY